MARLRLRWRRAPRLGVASSLLLAPLAFGCGGEVQSGYANPGAGSTDPSGMVTTADGTPVATDEQSTGTGTATTTTDGTAATDPNTGATTSMGAGGGATAVGDDSVATADGIDPDAPTPPAPTNPGNVVVRRLNHAEYNNTVRDLLRTSLRPADEFLADGTGAGFDTVGGALSLSPAYVRDYEEAAHALIADLYSDATRLAEIATCDVEAEGATCAEAIITAFAKRAFRRPVTATEVQTLMTPFQTAQTLGDTATEGLRHSLAAVLMSPAFLFKLEIDPDLSATAPRRLNDYELATRLSYALWSTMPDDALMAAADAGTLATDAGLAAEIERMLADFKIEALAQDFAAQWLDFRHLDAHEIDPQVFGDFDTALANSMKEEAKQFFLAFLNGEYAVNQMLNARFTYVDATLADHYGLTVQPQAGDGVALVDTSAEPRSGLLTLGAVLTSTSYSTRTSPVKRGQFVMDRLLCSEVPAPPPDVVGLMDEEAAEMFEAATLRERMEKHRVDPACMGCHSLMDPIGFGLENYDGIGRYRTQESESGLDIDSSGEVDGQAFSGAVDLATILSSDARFNNCVTEKFMTFALGRFLDQVDDETWVAYVAGTTRDASGNLATMIRTLMMSELFRSRQAVAMPAAVEEAAPVAAAQ